MAWTAPIARYGLIPALALGQSLCACALGAEAVEEPDLGSNEAAVGVFEAGMPEAAMADPLPPWLSDPRFDSGLPDPGPAYDAGSSGSPVGTPFDASRPSRASDAGTTRPARSDASTGGSSAGRCQASTCTNECSLAGPLKCCTDQGRCGCTWAPGAYCL